MEARLTYRLMEARPFTELRVARGEVFRIDLANAPGRMVWSATQDPVLDIVEGPNGQFAEITAAKVGTSHIELQPGVGARPLLVLTVHVYKDTSDEAFSFSAEVGPEELA